MENNSLIFVTGGAGLIGSNVVRELNSRGYTNIVIIDRFGTSIKWKNLVGLQYSDFVTVEDFKQKGLILEGKYPSVVIHLGACSSTTQKDMGYLIENNYNFTKDLIQTYTHYRCSRIVATSSAATYGLGENGFNDNDNLPYLESLRPLNAYAQSKNMTDIWAVKSGFIHNVCMIKPTNIFGPGEEHKIGMESMVLQAYRQISAMGSVKLFKSYKGEYKDGEQYRDFLYVKDAAKAIVDLAFRSDINGIYNLGSGTSTTWNTLVGYVFEAMGKPVDIQYVEMPDHLKAQYQYKTTANIEKLKNALPSYNVTPLKDAIQDYIQSHLISP
jgi:ADP-L-glycero-D-manno-heptose 6-epimerase